MKHLLLIISLMAISSCRAQQREETKIAAQLKQEVVQDLTQNILPFWAKYAPDPSGGFYGILQYDGTPVPDGKKGGILNARIVWTFSAAARILQDPQYLELANRAQRYYIDYFVDPQYGGTYYILNADGTPFDTQKDTYQNAYTIYALAEHYLATGNQESLDVAIANFHKMTTHAYDPLYGGFIESYSRDWQMVEVEFPKTMNTHLHILEAFTHLYRVWKDEELKNHLREMIDLIVHKILHNATWHQRLFFTIDWQSVGHIDSYGHDIECSWLLTEAAEVLGDEALIKETQRMALHIVDIQLKEGIDPNGAMIYEKEDDHINANLEWWPQTETVIGCLNAWQISGDKKYLDAAVRTWEWIKNYMIDREYGEWYRSVLPDGTPMKYRPKADHWRCPYHNSRMGFEVIVRFPQL